MTVKVDPPKETEKPKRLAKKKGPKKLTKIAFCDALRSGQSVITGKKWISDGRFAVRREIVPTELEKMLPKDLKDAAKAFWDEEQTQKILKKSFGFLLNVRSRVMDEQTMLDLLDGLAKKLEAGELKTATPTEVYIGGARMYAVGVSEKPGPVFIGESLDALLDWDADPQTADRKSALIRADGMAVVMPLKNPYFENAVGDIDRAKKALWRFLEEG